MFEEKLGKRRQTLSQILNICTPHKYQFMLMTKDNLNESSRSKPWHDVDSIN